MVGAVLFAVACSNGSDDGFQPTPDRLISVGVYIDEDGSGDPEETEGVPAARVALLCSPSPCVGPLGGDTVMTSSTRNSPPGVGVGVFQDVDVGTYRVSVAASVLGDSLEVQAMELRQQSGSGWLPGVEVNDFQVSFSDDVVYINLRLVRIVP
jgi:hypothetical protein